MARLCEGDPSCSAAIPCPTLCQPPFESTALSFGALHSPGASHSQALIPCLSLVSSLADLECGHTHTGFKRFTANSADPDYTGFNCSGWYRIPHATFIWQSPTRGIAPAFPCPKRLLCSFSAQHCSCADPLLEWSADCPCRLSSPRSLVQSGKCRHH